MIITLKKYHIQICGQDLIRHNNLSMNNDNCNNSLLFCLSIRFQFKLTQCEYKFIVLGIVK